jgi:hypothetical protein
MHTSSVLSTKPYKLTHIPYYPFKSLQREESVDAPVPFNPEEHIIEKVKIFLDL